MIWNKSYKMPFLHFSVCFFSVLSVSLWFVCFCSTPVLAHYNMLLPETASTKKGEAVTLIYQWGHPYEHQLFNALRPESLIVLTPDGKRIDLLETLQKKNVPAGEDKTVSAYRFRFVPEKRGDYVFVLKTPPIWMPDENEFFQDTVKVVLHVQTQRGWDALAGEGFEIVPLTRPYGLQPGMVFQAQLETQPTGPIRPVEIERYNSESPGELPPDEFITRTAKADKTGVVTGTLTESGWWCLTAARTNGTREHNGKECPVLQRSTFWVYVDEKPGK